ncbi:restriction endonuclease [Thermococcus sp. M36]|uniref:type I restriction enzyme HsdR N-terminal domain-containing protein n=1 Tax=Thermococcus sp. M36 TaxID=1638261 RepID=UPI0014391D82|nr:type I restriction enzyme HsdR N-terminal domain-containing protein [Thermococcus sp. M36]NJE04573.1 restriction endonuclease [Thermococcus sp. M36]
MDGLRRAVSNVLRKIKAHRELYTKNEEAVKQHLIGEVFQALGWDWNNPEEVRPEERTEDGRADYALILDGSVFAYVEAKNLGVNIARKDEPLRQLARYCFNAGVRYGILTNGSVWIAVKAFEEGSRLWDRVLLKVDIENEPVERSLLKLSLLSKEKIRDIERLSSLLKALELSFSGLKKEGYPEDVLVEYLTSGGASGLVPVADLTGREKPRAAYVHDGGWKMLPLPEKSVKGVLMAVLLYMEKRAAGYQKEEIRKAYEHIKAVRISPEAALKVLKKLEEEEGLRVAVEL